MANELNSNQIAQILPHRFPFALVDRITDYEPGQWAKGRKCVSVNEQFFCGHFPQEHVMPGVLILEAMAQVGCVAFLAQPENQGRIVLFGGVKDARFRRKVTPGDGVHTDGLPKRNWLWQGQGCRGWRGCGHGRADFCRRKGLKLVVFPKIGYDINIYI